MLTKILKNIGMTERQAKLYITGLKLGTASATKIATEIGENRITIYKTLQEMVRSGYAKEYGSKKRIQFAMLNPDEILYQQKEKTRKLEKAIPEITGLMKTFGEKPKILAYEGLEGLKTLYFSFLKSKSPIRVFVGKQSEHNEFNSFIRNEYTKIKTKSKIKVKAIVSNVNSFYVDNNFKNNEFVHINNDFVYTTNDIMIYDHNKIAICIYEKSSLSAFVIQSNTVYNFLAGIFDSTYSLLKTDM